MIKEAVLYTPSPLLYYVAHFFEIFHSDAKKYIRKEVWHGLMTIYLYMYGGVARNAILHLYAEKKMDLKLFCEVFF